MERLGLGEKTACLNRTLPAEGWGFSSQSEPRANHGWGNHQGSAHLSLGGTSKAGAPPKKRHEEQAAVGEQGKEAK